MVDMRRRCEMAGWIVALVTLTIVVYSSLTPQATSPQASQASQVSQLVRMIQNKTSNLVPAALKQKTQTIQVYGPDTVMIPGDDDLKNMDLLQLEELWMRYVENIQQACGSQQHMGAEFDGGYHVCEKYLQKDNCLIYAFGSRKMYQFEDDVEKTYGCTIHTFDPFDGQKDHQHSKKVTFHKWGLGDKDAGNLFTLKTIKNKLNHSGTTLDILKIDIEGGEWPAMPEMIASGELQNSKLLIFEFHVCLGGCKDFRFRNKDMYVTRLKALRDIYDAGFRLYYFRQWTMCHLVDENKRVKTGCHEVHFMKV